MIKKNTHIQNLKRKQEIDLCLKQTKSHCPNERSPYIYKKSFNLMYFITSNEKPTFRTDFRLQLDKRFCQKAFHGSWIFIMSALTRIMIKRKIRTGVLTFNIYIYIIQIMNNWLDFYGIWNLMCDAMQKAVNLYCHPQTDLFRSIRTHQCG